MKRDNDRVGMTGEAKDKEGKGLVGREVKKREKKKKADTGW